MLSIALIVVALLVLVAGVLLLVGIISPARLWKIVPFLGGSAPDRKRALLVFVPLVVVLLAAEGVLLALPRFSASLPDGHRVVAHESTGIKVAIENAGLTGGTFIADYSLDGEHQAEVSQLVPGSQTVDLDLPLPKDLEPGRHSILVGDTRFDIVALRPAAFTVASLHSDTKLAKTGERVSVTATVMNTGEAPGEFDGVLKADGRRCDAQPTTIGPGEQQELVYTYQSSKQGKHKLRLGDARCAQVVVKPMHYANGHFLQRSVGGGNGVLEVKNGDRPDAVLILTRQSAPHTPVVACYVGGRHSATISGIPDGKYWIYYTIGRDWNTYTDGFIDTIERGRFSTMAPFSTKSWTSSWTDSMYRYTQGHTQYTRWRITLNKVAGGNARTENVSEGGFPRVH